MESPMYNESEFMVMDDQIINSALIEIFEVLKSYPQANSWYRKAMLDIFKMDFKAPWFDFLKYSKDTPEYNEYVNSLKMPNFEIIKYDDWTGETDYESSNYHKVFIVTFSNGDTIRILIPWSNDDKEQVPLVLQSTKGLNDRKQVIEFLTGFIINSINFIVKSENFTHSIDGVRKLKRIFNGIKDYRSLNSLEGSNALLFSAN